MKKFSYLFIAIISFIGISSVKADTNKYLSNYYYPYSLYSFISSNYSSVIDNLITYYNNNWSNDYSNYVIFCYPISTSINNTNHTISFQDCNNLYIIPNNSTDIYLKHINSNFYLTIPYSNGTNYLYYEYNVLSDTYSTGSSIFNPSNILYSSKQSLYYSSANSDYNSITLPSYSNQELDVSYPLMTIEDGDTVPTYLSLVNGPSADFTEVDMSQYDYIILSLKNYNTTAFNTTIYSLGRLCFTPVYDYGMIQKNELINGYQTMGCTEYYNSLTPVSIFIIQADLDNHAVYYIKRYNDETNILKIPTSIFDITYITSENANNPNVIINNRSYPALPYSQLTDTANNSTETGYISGQVCALGDVNCEYKTGIGLDISDLFTQPLKVLQSVWTSITSIFILIGQFISLIPSPLKEFLISAFMLSIILGILKILIG